ncbi:MAG TPA: Gfo/Idh/MocA family oxidoreductase [Vicinamibacterales bacterium]|jgi:2-hydroxy-4-carboxymuconate semialdehyde hemiacetal dehydrogenase
MKICLAGTGAMGVTHVNALRKLDDVEVVSVASRTAEGGKAFAAEWQIPFHSTNLEECIDRAGVDAVILTTPSEQHAEQTILALGKGKHVQVEIPMSLNLPDAQRMLDAANKSGKVCMVTHTRRFSSPHREIRRRIQDGTFHLHHMVVETYFFRRTNLNMHGQPRSWVDNLLWHHACHSVDIAAWVTGDQNWDVWGQKGPDHPELGIPMDLTVAMKSKKGPLFTMAMSFNNKGPFGGFYRYIGEEETYKVYRDTMTDSEGKDVPLDGVPAFDRQDVEFVSAIRERRQPESNAASCVPTMALLDRIEKAMNR